MSNTATRLITLIMLLQRRPNQKADELARELGVSVRSLHRYITMLDELGIPVYSERGPHGGFSLVRGYKIPPLVFTPEEAVAVYLGTSLVEEMWGRLYRDAARGALAKLDNVLPDDQRHEIAWARRTLVATGMHRGDQSLMEPNLEKLRRAVRERRRVVMRYRGRSQVEPIQREVDPIALVHRWGLWDIVGHCHLRDALRSFRVDRVVELTLLEATFDVPADFDIHTYLETEPTARPQMTARLHFAPEVALAALDNRIYWESVEEVADGSVIATMSVPDLMWATSIAVSYGPSVRVLEPPELQRSVAEWASAVAATYA